MSVERGAVVHLQDGGELVRVDEVDDGDGGSHHKAKEAGHQDQPEAPSELEGEDDVLHVDDERTGGQEVPVHQVGEDHHGPGCRHHVGAVAGHDHQKEVHAQPHDEGGPQVDGGVVPGRAVVAPPAEPFRVYGEILRHGENGEGEALSQRPLVLLLELDWSVESEALVEVDVHADVAVVDGHGLQGDVGMGEADVDAKTPHDLVRREGLVGGGDLGLSGVPAAAVVADCVFKTKMYTLFQIINCFASYVGWPFRQRGRG